MVSLGMGKKRLVGCLVRQVPVPDLGIKTESSLSQE